jgi:hypothetical protein
MNKCRYKRAFLYDADFLVVSIQRDDVKNQAVVVAIMIFASSAALADTGRYTATLAQPLATKKDLIVNGNMFRCEGSTCILVSHPADPGSLHTCRALQHQVGVLTAYGVAGDEFDAAKLAQCNSPNSF